MEISAIKNTEDLAGLKEDWQRILALRPHSVFETYEWFKYAVGNRPRDDLHILKASEGSVAKAIAPARRRKSFFRYIWFDIPVYMAEFILDSFATFCDFVSVPHGEEALGLFVDELLRDGKLDLAVFSRIPESSSSAGALKNILSGKKKKFLVRTSSICPRIRFSGDWESYVKGTHQRFRKTMRSVNNRVEGLGGVGVEVRRGAQDAGGVFDAVISMCERNRKAAGSGYLAGSEDARRRFSSLLAAAGENGWLQAWILRKRDDVLAIEVDLAYAGRMHAIFAVYDDRYARCSPGSYLNYQILKHCARERLEYDFGPGGAGYKFFWTHDYVKTVEFIVFGRTMKAKVLYMMCALKESAKKILSTMRPDEGPR